MDPNDRNRREIQAAVFKALGHPSRLLIVQELSAGGRNVSQLTALVGADASTVSRHLSVLKQAGILTSEKQGAVVSYSLQVPCVLDFLVCVERVLEGSGR